MYTYVAVILILALSSLSEGTADMCLQPCSSSRDCVTEGEFTMWAPVSSGCNDCVTINNVPYTVCHDSGATIKQICSDVRYGLRLNDFRENRSHHENMFSLFEQCIVHRVRQMK